MDFQELAGDNDFTARIKHFHESVDEIGEFVRNACESNVYDKLSLDDKVKYDLFLSYSLNTLFWMYLRTQGVDPLKHPVKNEIDRIREYNVKTKEIQDRKIMPHIDVAAAQRFIRNGLWQPNQKDNDSGRQCENITDTG
ncbi:hypothetical protein L9F63_018940 [Diploptera punctata]|uniref:Nuclear nucleic acid-binding protein C1D n=1 Tax=Diploptera punctata TaxID=6984 RepID=A0AAD7ZVL8_DIPPU|nr:hypothetical protein L9F63_018940 [Diploptera punctata]